MKAYINELLKRKDLIKYLVISGLKAQHKNSYLGFFWWLLDPLLQIFIYYFVVVMVFQRARGAEYGIWLAIGLVVWRWISSSLTTSVRSIISQAGIITQVYLPKSTFPICTVLSEMINFGFGLIVVAIALVFFQIQPGLSYIWLPIVIGVQFLFLQGIALALAYVSVFIRDMEMMTRHIIRLMFYGSPVIWYADMVPERLRWILEINPIACFLSSYRNIIIYNSMPDFKFLGIIAVMSTVLIFLLINIYQKNEHKIIKVL